MREKLLYKTKFIFFDYDNYFEIKTKEKQRK